jgi:hypothetical protein
VENLPGELLFQQILFEDGVGESLDLDVDPLKSECISHQFHTLTACLSHIYCLYGVKYKFNGSVDTCES